MSHFDWITFFLQIASMLSVAIVFRQASRLIRLPDVVGELMGGILLGPTIFGAFFPQAFSWLFPESGTSLTAREAVIKLGLLFFLFVAGLEVNLAEARRSGIRIAATSISGILVPFAVGLASVWWFPELWGSSANGSSWIFPLFIGTCLSISALPVIARILMDLNLLKTGLGTVVMAAAMIDDLIGWSLFAILLSQFTTQGADSRSVGLTIGLVMMLFVLMLTIGRWIGQRSLSWLQSRPNWPNGFLGATSIVVLLAATLAEAIGIHAIFGAFLVGVAFAQSNGKRHEAHEMVYHFVISFFAPIYFVSVGLQANFVEFFDLRLVLFVLAVASLGKIGGVVLGARFARLPLRDALAVAFGMNARGAMGMVLASVALEHRLIDTRIFVALIVMSLVTSVISGPVMHRLLLARPAEVTCPEIAVRQI